MRPERGRDPGRGRSSRCGTRSWDPGVMPWAQGRCSTPEPPGGPDHQDSSVDGRKLQTERSSHLCLALLQLLQEVVQVAHLSEHVLPFTLLRRLHGGFPCTALLSQPGGGHAHTLAGAPTPPSVRNVLEEQNRVFENISESASTPTRVSGQTFLRKQEGMGCTR